MNHFMHIGCPIIVYQIWESDLCLDRNFLLILGVLPFHYLFYYAKNDLENNTGKSKEDTGAHSLRYVYMQVDQPSQAY